MLSVTLSGPNGLYDNREKGKASEIAIVFLENFRIGHFIENS